MTRNANDIILLEGRPQIEGRIGKLEARQTEAEAALPFALLDCHDGSIRQSGQVLLEAGPHLVLFRDGGMLTQPAQRSGNFVADLADGPVKDALKDTSPLRSLLAIGSGKLGHARVALLDDEGKTRARADLGFLHPSGSGRAVTLAVVQRLRGYDKAHRALAAHLRGAKPAQDHDLADLVAILFPEHEPYDPKPRVGIAPDDPAHDAASRIIRAHLAVIRQNEAGIIADHDSEFLHDYRVALRKIRSVVSLLRGVYDEAQTEDLKRRFSDLMAPTNRLRDLDVQLLDRAACHDLLPETLHDGLTLMYDLFSRERRQEHRKIARRLASAEYRADMSALQDRFAQGSGPAPGPEAGHPAHDFACGLIWRRYRKICKIAAGIDDATPDAEVHELRINCKKLRYLIEIFAPLFPRDRLRVLLQPLRELQDNLGLFNDCSVQQAALQDFLARHPSKGLKDERRMATSIGALIAVLHRRQLHERARVVSSFAHFDSPAIRDEFANLFGGKGA